MPYLGTELLIYIHKKFALLTERLINPKSKQLKLKKFKFKMSLFRNFNIYGIKWGKKAKNL